MKIHFNKPHNKAISKRSKELQTTPSLLRDGRKPTCSLSRIWYVLTSLCNLTKLVIKSDRARAINKDCKYRNTLTKQKNHQTVYWRLVYEVLNAIKIWILGQTIQVDGAFTQSLFFSQLHQKTQLYYIPRCIVNYMIAGAQSSHNVFTCVWGQHGAWSELCSFSV